MALSNDEFDRFLHGAGHGAYKCTFCGHTVYRKNIGEGKNAPPGELRFTPEGADGYHPFYSISCGNCGRADFFHENLVTAWLRKNSSKGTK